VLATVLLGVLITLSLFVAVVGGAVVDHRRVASAADLAALAGAQALQDGRPGCATAGAVARRNGARLTGCTVTGPVLSLGAARTTRSVLGHRLVVRSTARAGPAGGAGAGALQVAGRPSQNG
jgi:secretion/DNA translocation related TadE-like protein